MCLPRCSARMIYFWILLRIPEEKLKIVVDDTIAQVKVRSPPVATQVIPGPGLSWFHCREQVALTAPPRMNVAMETVLAIISCGYKKANKEEVTVLWDIETIFIRRRWFSRGNTRNTLNGDRLAECSWKLEKRWNKSDNAFNQALMYWCFRCYVHETSRNTSNAKLNSTRRCLGSCKGFRESNSAGNGSFPFMADK